MKLLRLVLKNFKGIRNFELDTLGGNVNVFGDNAAGKTTLFDAFVWLLFDKDSQNKKDFQIKTLDQTGKVIHGLEHEVEAVFDINGIKLTLKKVFSEKWTKKRGSITAEFTGHTTDYFVNDVPVKKGEYSARVEEVAKEDIFKLLTSPNYFNDQLHWEERRKILLEVCGDISDEDVIASSEKLSPLSGILEQRKLEEHLRIIKSKKSTINQEIQKVPVRIDEVSRNLPEIDGLNAEEIQNKLDLTNHFIEERQQEIVRIENGGEVAAKTKQLRELQGEMLDLKNELRKETDVKVNEKRKELNETKGKLLELKGDLRSYNSDLARNQIEINKLNEAIKEKRENWHQVNSEQFVFNQADVCPTCGQALPQEQIAAAREKALSQFNLDKSERLERIKEDGSTQKAKVDKLQDENHSIIQKIKELEEAITKTEEIEKAQLSEINALESEVNQISVNQASTNPNLLKKSQEITKLEEVISKLQTSTSERVSSIREEVANLKLEADQLNTSKAKLEQHENGKKRIQELNEEHKKLAREYEKLEHELYLCEEFVKAKVALLEGKINSRFQYARFRLFKEQINGGIEPCCETLYKGVPYSSGLNNAARINVGIDIINTLSEHYGFAPPIFIDNAESVTEIAEAKGQMICPVVSKPDKQLRTEVM